MPEDSRFAYARLLLRNWKSPRGVLLQLMQRPYVLPAMLALAIADLGCSTPSTSKATAPPRSPPAWPRIGEPCHFDRTPTPDPSATPQRVFVELATVTGDLEAVMRKPTLVRGDGPSDPEPPRFSDLLTDPRLTIPHVSNVLATNDSPTTVSWDIARADGNGGAPESERWDLTLTAHMEPTQSQDVRLEITLVPAPPLGTPEGSWSVPEHRRVHTTVTVKDQQTVVLGGFSKHRQHPDQSVLVVTPYVIRSDADLHSLFECKLKQSRESHVAR